MLSPARVRRHTHGPRQGPHAGGRGNRKEAENMGNYLAAIWRCRFFWLSLVKMDLRTRYRRSVLGMGWSLLHPIAMTCTICLVFGKMWQQDVVKFIPHLLGGLACWN